MGLILSDTNVIIYLLDGDKAIAELFDENIISISFITELELLSARKIFPISGSKNQGIYSGVKNL